MRARGTAGRVPTASAAAAAGPPRRRGAQLKVMAHNVQTLRPTPGGGIVGDEGKLANLVPCWLEHQADIIVAVGTQITHADRTATQARLNNITRQEQIRRGQGPSGGWACFWNYAPSPALQPTPPGTGVRADVAGAAGGGDDSARDGDPQTGVPSRATGVLIAVRRSLIVSGALTTHGDLCTRSSDGRLLSLPITWGGHRLLLAGVYLPPAGDKAAYIEDDLQRFVTLAQNKIPTTPSQSPPSLILAGDLNFAPNPLTDRFRSPTAAPAAASSAAAAAAPAHLAPPLQPTPSPGDSAPSAAFSRTFPSLIDIWRHRHPNRREFTYNYNYTNGYGMSRIDHIHTDPGLLPFIDQAYIATGKGGSDHSPVALRLLAGPTTQTPAGRGLRRTRMDFTKDTALQHDFERFLARALTRRPQAGAALLAWWPQFKLIITSHALALNRRYRSATAAAATSAARRTTTTAVFSATNTLSQSILSAGAASPAARSAHATLTAAHAANAAAAHTEAQRHSVIRTREWIAQGERPSAALTAALRLPVDCRHISALRAPGGRLVSDGPEMAQIMVDHCAKISTTTPTDPQAQADVLTALAAHTVQLPAPAAAALAAPTISIAEVVQALRKTKPGKAPGPDGIPTELYRHFRTQLAPVLADLYTAAWAQDSLPAGFLDGVISVIYKKGDKSNPSNYRPITLLNTDYRLLSRLLSDRLLPCLDILIPHTQTAFLPGRRIGDTILLQQLLPCAMQRENSAALTLFLDQVKAYDTVNRPFLFAAAAAAGLPPPFVSLMKLLLSGTSARALVNGFVSRPAPFTAGLRQGCALAPAEYLLVGHALAAWLAHQGLGVPWPLHAPPPGGGAAGGGGPAVTTPPAPRLPSSPLPLPQPPTHPLTVAQYADDTRVFLRDPRDVPLFTSSMRVFTAATGQHLNKPKCAALLIGAAAPVAAMRAAIISMQQPAPTTPPTSHTSTRQLPTPQPPTVDGIPLCEEVEALGVVFSNNAADPPEWDHKVAGVQACYSKISQLPLSMFGRAIASSAYGVSTLLYATEFRGDLPATRLQTLQRDAARLVNHGKAPGVSPGRDFTAIRKDLIAGSPAAGGFGALPLEAHIQARLAVWGAKFLTGDPAVPWVRLARALFHSLRPAAARDPLGFIFTPDIPPLAPLPAPLQRIRSALQAIDKPMRGDPLLYAPHSGPWCLFVPLWGNTSLLTNRLPAASVADANNIPPPRRTPLQPGDDVYITRRVWEKAAVWRSNTPGSTDAQETTQRQTYLQQETQDLIQQRADVVAAGASGAEFDRLVARRLWGGGDAMPLEVAFGCITASRTRLLTIKDLLDAITLLDQTALIRHSDSRRTSYMRIVNYYWPDPLGVASTFGDALLLRQVLLWLEHALPPNWLTAAHQALPLADPPPDLIGWRPPAPPTGAAPRRLTATDPRARQPDFSAMQRRATRDATGWYVPVKQTLTLVTLDELTVKHATSLLTKPLISERTASFEAFSQEARATGPAAGPAHGGPPPPLTAARDDAHRLVTITLPRLWKLPVYNRRKEAFWLLAWDGHPTPARMHLDSPCPCGLGDARPGRAHVFWECKVAQAVRTALESQLPAAARPLPCSSVWLAREPRGVHPHVWGVVCMAAIDALSTGRSTLARYTLRPRPSVLPPPGPRQRTLPELWNRAASGAGTSGSTPAAAGASASGSTAPGGRPPSGDGASGPTTATAGTSASGSAAPDGRPPRAPAGPHPRGPAPHTATSVVAVAVAQAQAILQARLDEACLVLGQNPWGLAHDHPFIRWDPNTQRLRAARLI